MQRFFAAKLDKAGTGDQPRGEAAVFDGYCPVARAMKDQSRYLQAHDAVSGIYVTVLFHSPLGAFSTGGPSPMVE